MGENAFKSLNIYTNDTKTQWPNLCEVLPAELSWSRAYGDKVDSQQTDDWHRALQDTYQQMGIFERQLRSKLWMWHWASNHARSTAFFSLNLQWCCAEMCSALVEKHLMLVDSIRRSFINSFVTYILNIHWPEASQGYKTWHQICQIWA